MASVIPTYPGLPRHTMSVDLGGTVFQLRFTWRERLGAWYLDVRDANEAALVTGVRLSSSWMPIEHYSVESGPAGVLYVRGPDEYRRDDFGDGVDLVYYDRTEIPATAAPTLIVDSSPPASP